MIRRLAVLVSALLAAALAALAVDVLLVPGRIAADDARFHAAPLRQQDPWADPGLLPWRPAERALDVGDDVAYRRTIWLYRQVQPGVVEIAGPNQPLLEALRGKAVSEVATRSRLEPDPIRRAQLLNMHGLFTFARYTSFSASDKERLLREALGTFRNAVRLDPGNADARANLELILREAQGVGLPGEDPDLADPTGGKISGTGRSGGGY